MSDKIEACACGRTEQEVSHPGNRDAVYYFRRCACGWSIKRTTEKDRDAAWNSVMRAARMMKRLREPVGKSKDGGIDLTHLPKGKPTAYSEGGRAR